MLVLSRKIGEQIIIDEQIQVAVLEVNGDRVKFGFVAPRNVVIRREELCCDKKPIINHDGELKQKSI